MATSNTTINFPITRRSPRSIQRFCYGVTVPSLTDAQTALLLSLAHCSGWSADHIHYKFRCLTDISLTAEQIWDLHWEWIRARGGVEVPVYSGELEIMGLLCREVGFKAIEQLPTPLYKRKRPVSFFGCFKL